MNSIAQTIKVVEKEIAALKKALADKEALLPGLRLAAQLSGHPGEEHGDNGETLDEGMRLRIGPAPLKVLELLEDGDPVPYTAILKVVDDTREGRYAIRNLVERNLAEHDEDDDTTTITSMGSVFLKKYREKQ